MSLSSTSIRNAAGFPLGMKQCQSKPLGTILQQHTIRVTVSLVSSNRLQILGIFIGLDGGIDGLVHLSDVSWAENADESIRNFSKGEEVETVVLAVDAERERISLGVKQLEKDPFSNFVAENPKGTIVKGIAQNVDVKYVNITLSEGVEGTMKATEISLEKVVDDARSVIKEGEELEVKITAIDRKKAHNQLVN